MVGWGSLIWDPRQLPLSSAWNPDGPELPVEFGRVSKDGRLTLALREGVASVPTLWALMRVEELEEAREQLARRERADPDQIGSLDGAGRGCVASLDPIHGESLPRVRSWLSDRPLDAVVWTGLPSNFEDRTGRTLSVEAAVGYLEGLSDDARQVAERYVRRAPAQVRTIIRQGLERELGWTAAGAA